MALEMVALMGAFGGGGTGRIDQLLDKRPDLAKRLVRLDPVVAAATFAGLLTVAELQANGCRIEALVHLALALGRGKQKPNEKFAAELFRHLGDGGLASR